MLRLAQLGSNSAAATLGYFCLLSEDNDGIDRESGLSLCRAAANRGDSYAQYVTAWHEYELGHIRSFQRWINRSARQRFTPALGDLALLMLSPRKRSNRRPDLAKRIFFFAIRRGHLASIILFLARSLVGSFGWHYRVIALIAFPIAIIIVGFATRIYPFSCAWCSFTAASFVDFASTGRPCEGGCIAWEGGVNDPLRSGRPAAAAARSNRSHRDRRTSRNDPRVPGRSP